MKVWASDLELIGALDQWAGAANHVVEIGIGWHHWVHAVLLFDTKVDQRGARSLPRAGDHWLDLGARGNPESNQPVRLRELDEIRILQRGRHVPAAVEEFLPLSNHSQEAVVDDRDVDLDPFLRAGGQLAGRHLKAAITH